MWFKQIQLYQLTAPINYSPEKLIEKLEPLAFTPCLPSFPSSTGWVSPFEDDNAPLVHALNGYIMLCLQFEEKILPASVIRQELKEKIKKIQTAEDRRVRQKEKLSLKDEIVCTLMPRAFTRLTRVYAYIDTKNNWLVLNTTNAAKSEQFITMFKKSVSEGITTFDIKKPSSIVTVWLKNQNYPKDFSVEKACVLQDPNQQNRIIRCQQQNLFANGIQSLIKEGCEVKQLALCWQDRVNFVLAEDFSLRSIQFQEDVISQSDEIETETKQQEFDANFFIMTETLQGMIKDLLEIFADTSEKKHAAIQSEAVTA